MARGTSATSNETGTCAQRVARIACCQCRPSLVLPVFALAGILAVEELGPWKGDVVLLSLLLGHVVAAS